MAVVLAPDYLLAALGRVYNHAECLDLALQQPPARLVELHRHQARRELDDMGLEAEVFSALAASRPRKAAADHGADARLLCRGPDDFEVFDRAIDEAAAPVMSRNRRNEGIGAGSEHQFVVRHFAVTRGAYRLAVAVYRNHRIVEPKRDALFLEEPFRHYTEIDGRLSREKAGELHAVVGCTRFFAEHRHVDGVASHSTGQLLQEALPDHAVSDHDNFFHLHAGFLNCSLTGQSATHCGASQFTRSSVRAVCSSPGTFAPSLCT
jgi:hypothetical protein